MELGARALSRGVRLVVHDEIDSTNDEAKRLIDAGEQGPLWVAAARQSKGRGRLGRRWISLPGNLHASLIVTGFGPPRAAPQLGFVAGVAAMKALLEDVNASSRLALKWPNDILLDGAKAGGILLEGVSLPRRSGAPGDLACVIGIGVNCGSSPAGLDRPVSDLARLGGLAPAAAVLFQRLSDTMVETLDLWAGGAGFASVRERWLGFAAGLGQNVKVALAQETLEGRFETIDEAGRLVLATPEGRRLVEAGDVFLPEICARDGRAEDGA